MATVEERLNDLERKVFDLFKLGGWKGLTTDEIEVRLDLTHQCASARVSELWHKHDLIEPRGVRRKTRAGRPATVYVMKGLPEAATRQGLEP